MKILLSLLVLVLIPIISANALLNDTIEITKPAIQKDKIQVNVLINNYSSDLRISLANQTVTTKDVIVIPDIMLHKGPVGINSTYYLGWNEALISINNTKIPELEFGVTSNSEGDVIIEFVNYSHPSGFGGSTEKYNHKSIITVFNIELLSDNQIKAVVRHELGHALGLGHTSATEDLMNERINQYYPYISPCALQGIEQLYSNKTHLEVRCLK